MYNIIYLSKVFDTDGYYNNGKTCYGGVICNHAHGTLPLFCYLLAVADLQWSF
ncbi:hypothetical protein Sjap_008961 [Stephania japonica]|uniref:Uncharacterized protein n=1 Tax=Stephania japonica TaxID=461633 RepID=A0AAP0PBV5_9MAGN